MKSLPQHIAFVHLALAAREEQSAPRLADKVSGRVVIDRLRERVLREQQRQALQEELRVLEAEMSMITWPSKEDRLRAEQRLRIIKQQLSEKKRKKIGQET